MKTQIDAPVCALPIATPDGEFVARYSPKGLCGLEFPPAAKRPKHEARAVEIPLQIRRWHVLTARAVARVLAGQAPGTLPPLDLSAGTEFQRRVWAALRRIARGETRGYGEVAQMIGKPAAVRAVGGACGANPIPVLVPCHRVLAASQRLGGFSAGLHWKRLLLGREGIRLPREE